MQKIMVYSESGGVTKTTTAVSIATTAALQGRKVLLIDLDPRGAATEWLNVAPKKEGLHVGAIVAAEDPTGWAEGMAVESNWTPNLRFIPSHRNLANRERDITDHIELRLKASLVDVDADLVILDCPNRQAGTLTQSALNAADTVVYAAAPTLSGITGYRGAVATVDRYRANRKMIEAPDNLSGGEYIVVGRVKFYGRNLSIPAREAIDSFRETGIMVERIVLECSDVETAQMRGAWLADYDSLDDVVGAYEAITKEVVR